MSVVFLDTSAFMKLYLPERGSVWLKNYINGKQVIISELVLLESATTLARLYRQGIFTKRQAAILYAQIRKDRNTYELVLLTEARQLERAVSLGFNLPLNQRVRALDAIQLAAAGIARDKANNLTPIEPFIFISSDNQLLGAAQSQAFTVENPESYP